MAIDVGLHHVTEYHFDKKVEVYPHVVRLRPAPHCRTPIHRYSLKVEPGGHFINWQQDPFGNYLARLVFPEKVNRLRFAVDVVAELTVVNPFDFFLEESAQKAPFDYEARLKSFLAPYLAVEEAGPRLKDWLAEVDRDEQPTVDFLVALNTRLQQDIAYSVRMEPGVQTCEQTLKRAIGSCRDTGWLLVQVLRHLGIAARFVSGYLVQLRADEKSLDGPSGPDADFTDLHAWAEAYLPGAGWVGLDPTSGLFAGEGHIPLACAPHPAGAAPIEGATAPCEVSFHFSNEVQRVREDPRVTYPYTDDQWTLIDSLGDAMDARLSSAGIELTMGGEPTFVSVDDMESEEWTTAALGDHKWELATDLAGRLYDEFAPGGVMHFGQGKWYPGEPLPRWAIAAYWRTDGHPLWRETSRLHGCKGAVTSGEASSADAARFAKALARELGVSPDAVAPGYEDTLYYLWREGALPPGVNLEGEDTAPVNWADPFERDRLRRVLGGQLGKPVGYALPLFYREGYWYSQPWQFRRGQMYLVPGDSPMGYRLPLDSLDAAPLLEPSFERDPFERREPLRQPPGRRESALRRSKVTDKGESGTAAGDDAARLAEQARTDKAPEPPEIVRTALCVEARDGVLHIFMPPLTELEAAVGLLAALEAAAVECELTVKLEGYPLPEDERVQVLKITPDPGVIEVNVHPSRNWREMVNVTSTLYRHAREARLATEKFMLDGRHTGTGGGNHVTLGGPTPAQSPLLNRPDLLASLVAYWQHHPALSYLFSGSFVGPTSQAPRVDEARDDTLYELEVALSQAHALAGQGQFAPWLVDRVFRNLLIDVTGNTHRAEFCIDKLYSPDSATGRLGLLELRAFEMPPHARMSLLQMLLLRSLVVRFAEQPFRAAPVRWGNALHDRFMLPHFVWSDLGQVISELNEARVPMALEWFEPFMEFRFPRYGTVTVGDLQLELRFAIEPWNVLGEEATGQGTARFVDSSVERVQVRVTGMAAQRYALLCNGRRVPLRATGVDGEFVAGVRFKAWDPPSGLHPTVQAQPTLVFDVVDIPNQRTIGGCTYHVAHPGGRNYDVFPVNAAEAEARRMARFWPHGHNPGPAVLPPPIDNQAYPFTLDLRAVDGGAS